jgi:hypothetical protein
MRQKSEGERKMEKAENRIAKLACVLLAGGVLIAALMIRPMAVKAHIVPSPCDFTTGGGFVITDSGNHANFGLVGGCKNGGFFGHVNFVDHDTTGIFAGLHVSSDTIDAYFEPAAGSNVRDICGTADTNLFGTVKFRARTEDNGDPNPGGIGVDKFGLKITGVSPPFTGVSAVVVSTRTLAGGDIELHKPNPSTTGPSTPPDEITACGSDDSGLGI